MGTSCSPEFMFRSKLGSRKEDGIRKALVEPLAPWESLAPPEAWTTLQYWWVNLLQSSCPAVPDGAGSQPGQREAAPAALDPISPVPGHRALLWGCHYTAPPHPRNCPAPWPWLSGLRDCSPALPIVVLSSWGSPALSSHGLVPRPSCPHSQGLPRPFGRCGSILGISALQTPPCPGILPSPLDHHHPGDLRAAPPLRGLRAP